MQANESSLGLCITLQIRPSRPATEFGAALGNPPSPVGLMGPVQRLNYLRRHVYSWLPHDRYTTIPCLRFTMEPVGLEICGLTWWRRPHFWYSGDALHVLPMIVQRQYARRVVFTV